MAQELRSDGGCGGCFVARNQCCNTLLFIAEFFGVFDKDFAQTFVAGAGPAAPDEERRGLDSSGRGAGSVGSANLVPSYRARRSTDAERSSRTESVQPPSALLLTFLDRQS